jgi:sec-independent protein translocase protein TatB
MFDFGEILVIGGVALVVLGPERLPATARTIGQWVGRLQQQVGQMKTEFDREFHLADLRRMGEEARAQARSVESGVRDAVAEVRDQATAVAADATAPLLGDNSWSGGPPPPAASFVRRYRPRPTIDDLTRDIERLKRELALPDAAPGTRRRLAPRSRINRVRIRR